MKPSDLSEFFSLLGKAKKEKEEEFDNLLKEADINLDDLTSSLVSGIKEAKEDQKKQKKNEEKLIEQLDSIIDVIENPKEVKDITEPAVTVGVPEDFDVTTLEDADDNETVEIIDVIKPEPIKTPEISDTVAQAIKFIEETNIKEEIENSDDTNLDKLKIEIKQVRDILYKVLAHGPGSGEVRVLKMDDVDEDSAKVDGKVLQYQSSSGKFVGVGMASTDNVRTGILDVAGIATFRSNTLVGTGVTLSVDGDGFFTGVVTATTFSGAFSGDGSGLTGVANTDVIFTDKISLPDSIVGSINIGIGSDLQLFHSGNGSFIKDAGTGPLTVLTNNLLIRNAANNEEMIVASENGSVELYHDDSKKLETASGGVTVTGTAVATAFEDSNGIGINTANVRTGILDVAGISTFRDRAQFDGSVGVGVANPLQKLHVNEGNIILTNSTAPQIRINSGSTDSGSTRIIFGLATGSNQFINGSTSNDACFTSPSNMLFGIGNARKFRIKTTDVLTDVDLIPSGDNQTSLGRSNARWSDLFAVDATFSGNVSIAGTLTYEDVTNVDSVGIITARSGVLVGSGITLSPDGDGFYTGIVTATSFVGGLPITNGADNRVITATSASAIQGEAGLTFDGTTLTNAGSGFKGITIAPNTNNSATLRLQNSQANYTVSNITGGSFSIGDGSGTKFTINSSGTVGINNDLEVTSDVKVGSGITLSPDGDIFSVGVTTFRDTIRFEGSSGQRYINYFNFGRLQFNNNVAAAFGNSSQGRVQHDGTHLKILNNASDVSGNIIIQAHSGEDSIIANQHGSIELYHNDSKKFETAETGAVVTGILTATSSVNVGSGITLSPDGDIFTVGVSTFSNEAVISGQNPALTFVQTSGSLSDNQYRIIGGSGKLTLQVSANNGASYATAVSIGGIGNIFIPDNDKVFFGTNNDAYIQHDNSNLNVINTTGNIDVTGNVLLNNDLKVGSGITLSPDGDIFAVGVSTFVGNLEIRPSNGQQTPRIYYDDSIAEALIFQDNVHARFGGSSDLRIYHDGSQSIIQDTGTGQLRISGENTVAITNANGTESYGRFINNGQVELFYNNTKRIETTDSGAEITGDLETTSDVKVGSGITLSPDGDLFTVGVSTLGGVLDVDGSITCDDIITAGALLHEGDTDTLVHFSAANTIQLKTGGTSRLLVNNFGVNLENGYFNTNGNRILIGDSSSSTDDRLCFGDSQDLEIYHDGSHSYVSDQGTGQLKILSSTLSVKDAGDNTLALEAVPTTYVKLFYNGSNKLETTNTGITVTGTTVADGADINGDLDASGTATLGSGGSGQAILQYQGSTRLTTQSWGVQSTGTIQAIGNLEAANTSSETEGKQIHIKNLKSGGGVKNVLTLSHESNNSSITGHVGNISINAPIVSISTNFTVAGDSTLTGTVGFGTHITLQDDAEIRLGEKVSGGNRVGDFVIRHDPNMFGSIYNVIQSTNGNIQIENRDTGGSTRFLYLKADQVQLRSYSTNEAFIDTKVNQWVKLFYNNSEKLATADSGVEITGDLTVSGSVSEGSDIRLKTNIKPIEDPIDKVTQIEGVSFNWKKDNKPALGVIADQVEKIIPELVQGDDPKTVNYNGLIGLLIEAVKDQQTQIDSLKERLSKLE